MDLQLPALVTVSFFGKSQIAIISLPFFPFPLILVSLKFPENYLSQFPPPQAFPFSMISQKIMAEFCGIRGTFALITLDLLPKVSQLQLSTGTRISNFHEEMADLLQKTIQAMSLDEEEPLTLPDSPRY